MNLPGMVHIFAKSRAGFSPRAVGENPTAADAAGVNAMLAKYTATTAASRCAG